MPGLGTLINCAGVIGGGFLGLLFGKGLKKRFQDIMICVCGLSVIFIGVSGALQKMLVIDTSSGSISVKGTLMMIFSLLLGAVAGELIDIDKRAETFGAWLKKKSKSEKDALFVDGFVSASLTICIGAMSVLGPINDVLYKDYTILITKTILDAIIVMALASSMGKGPIFSVLPLILVQGFFTAVAKLIEPILNEAALTNLSLVGSILIFLIGINLVFGKKIKVANFLPSLIFAVICGYLPFKI
ncbi:MAG: DUF554 domain-containing protein [Clostridiales bacterium]|nr:DUF554 domain-containing protein [Clostridiales bacterium]